LLLHDESSERAIKKLSFLFLARFSNMDSIEAKKVGVHLEMAMFTTEIVSVV
jgi:hypothetical protein